MALISSNGTGGGLASLGSSWTGGIPPSSGDSVEILLTDTIEIDGTYSWGDGTATALSVVGTIEMSSTLTSGLTVIGTATLSNGSWLRANIVQTIDVNVVSITSTAQTTIATAVWTTNLPIINGDPKYLISLTGNYIISIIGNKLISIGA